jgi:hypothetical protein
VTCLWRVAAGGGEEENRRERERLSKGDPLFFSRAASLSLTQSAIAQRKHTTRLGVCCCCTRTHANTRTHALAPNDHETRARLSPHRFQKTTLVSRGTHSRSIHDDAVVVVVLLRAHGGVQASGAGRAGRARRRAQGERESETERRAAAPRVRRRQRARARLPVPRLSNLLLVCLSPLVPSFRHSHTAPPPLSNPHHPENNPNSPRSPAAPPLPPPPRRAALPPPPSPTPTTAASTSPLPLPATPTPPTNPQSTASSSSLRAKEALARPPRPPTWA